MTLDNMTGITEGSYTGFCKRQLITCNFVKACNGVCPFEDALKHADQMQTMNEQHTVDHDKDWIIGCIQHDGFIKTDRFDKANQIILEALSADAVQGEWGHMMIDGNKLMLALSEWWYSSFGLEETEESKAIHKVMDEVERYVDHEKSADYWIPCSERLPSEDGCYLVSTTGTNNDIIDIAYYTEEIWHKASRIKAWMPLPKPYREESEVEE